MIMIGRGVLGDRGPKTVRLSAGDQPMASRSIKWIDVIDQW